MLRQQSKAKQLRNSYQNIFNNADGKRVLNDLVTRCHIFSTIYGGGQNHDTLFLEGERNVGLYILAMCTPQNEDNLKIINEYLEGEDES